MKTLTLSTSSPSPRRALVHPLWLGSLAVLALNDHVLKGAGIVPDVVTGKLSDFAGMLVAPLLLASLLGLERRRIWLGAHAAVGFVFAAIQLAPAAATLWGTAMAGVGFPWFITPDPTDLIALPMLAVSAWVYPRLMVGNVRDHVRSSAEFGVAGMGVALCAATSPPPEEFVEPDLFTDVWLHNATEDALVVRVRPLKASVDADCDAIEADPGRLLSEPLFGNAVAWTLQSGENLSVRQGVEGRQSSGWWDTDGGAEDLPTRECMVGLVDVDGVAPAIFFWRDGDLEEKSVPTQEWHEDISGGVMIEMGQDGQARLTHDDEGIVHTVITALPPTAGACAPQHEGDRIAWSDVPVGLHRVSAWEPGIDGCIQVSLVSSGADIETAPSRQWYLCVPAPIFPFEAGQDISIETIDTGASTGVRVASQEASLGELWVYAGGLAPSTKGVAFAPVPDYGCELRAEPECGTISRSAVIVAGGGKYETVQIAAGQAPQTLQGDDGSQAIVYVAHAQERIALDPECAEGPDTIGDDVEVAVTLIPAGQ